VLGVWWDWLCSPGTLHLPSLFPHSLLLSSLFLATHSHPLGPMVGLVDCPVCLGKIVVKWRDEENQCEPIDHLMELCRFNSVHSCPPHSAFHRPHKIVNIFLNMIHTHRNCNIFLFCTNTHSDGCYAQITSQSTKN
jgi:hypothetical protein